MLQNEIMLHFNNSQLDFSIDKMLIGIGAAKHIAKSNNKHLGYHYEKGCFVFSIHQFVAKDEDEKNNVIEPIYIPSYIT